MLKLNLAILFFFFILSVTFGQEIPPKSSLFWAVGYSVPFRSFVPSYGYLGASLPLNNGTSAGLRLSIPELFMRNYCIDLGIRAESPWDTSWYKPAALFSLSAKGPFSFESIRFIPRIGVENTFIVSGDISVRVNAIGNIDLRDFTGVDFYIDAATVVLFPKTDNLFFGVFIQQLGRYSSVSRSYLGQMLLIFGFEHPLEY